MPNSNKLTADEKKDLRNKHRLYTKLSGDVIWLLLEENGFDAEQCGKAMDFFIAEMHSVLKMMNKLKQGKAKYFTLRSLYADSSICPQCMPLLGKVLTTANPEWQKFLPPFAVGCSISCEILNESEISQDDLNTEDIIIPPVCPLLCPFLSEELWLKK